MVISLNVDDFQERFILPAALGPAQMCFLHPLGPSLQLNLVSSVYITLYTLTGDPSLPLLV